MRLPSLSLSILVGSWTVRTEAWVSYGRIHRRHSANPSLQQSQCKASFALFASDPETEQAPYFASLDETPPSESSLSTNEGGDIPLEVASSRGKVNEIDFCIAPSDVSLSRAYATTASSATSAPGGSNGSKQGSVQPAADASQPLLSLTRALNNASNRAVRRILLARSWPSPEALNLSLKIVTAAAAAAAEANQSGRKCPIPRSILNVLTRKRKQAAANNSPSPMDSKRGRTDAEYVQDQIQNFAQNYGQLPGYPQAQDFLQAILSLATSGVEAETVPNVLKDGIYDESYKRVLGVLKTVGVQFEIDPETKRRKIAPQLANQDICWSMLDKLQLRKEASEKNNAGEKTQEKQVDGGGEEEEEIAKEDLGGVLLSSKEPTMTRQLNSLANIAQRALLFGGDQELLVLAETLDADREAFVEHWYPDSGDIPNAFAKETRPGVQFLNAMVQLLRDCYTNGVVTDMVPTLPLLTSYANAYERLVASAVELGSGYLKPVPTDLMTLPKPRTPTEELGRFAVWESNFRQLDGAPATPYPQDMVGTWEVRDEIGGETIGISTVEFAEEGNVQVKEPLEGLRWRLDPGPTHLDTCTFQVLGSDGTILQYRGFIDRGARLEARFSKRSIKIRGSVMFQMRDGSVDYYKDILPINYKTGTTKFVMTKQE